MIKSLSSPLAIILLLAIGAMGCNKNKTVADQENTDEGVTSATQPDDNDESERSYLQQATDLFEKAKEAGQTTANNAGDWIGSQMSGALEATGNAAQDTGDWVTETYESLKSQGLTSANNATEWLQQDLKNINAIEYKIIPKSAENLEQKLNELGAQRWDCFAVDDSSFYLKRKSRSYLRHVPVKDLLKLFPTGSSDE